MDPILVAAAQRWGIHFEGAPNARFQSPEMAHDSRLAQDAQPSLVTVSNSGILAMLTTYIDPKVKSGSHAKID